MKIVAIGKPVDRVAAESVLLESLHQCIAEHVGVMTIAQVLGILDICKMEVVEQNQEE